jgi:hypothetical protein
VADEHDELLPPERIAFGWRSAFSAAIKASFQRALAPVRHRRARIQEKGKTVISERIVCAAKSFYYNILWLSDW